MGRAKEKKNKLVATSNMNNELEHVRKIAIHKAIYIKKKRKRQSDATIQHKHQ